jgi:predicted O-methyltransferase YrrM
LFVPQLPVSAHGLSEALWETILESTAYRTHYARGEFFRTIDTLEELRSGAKVDTGSIPASTAWLLYSAVCHFRPARILEVGTYIGKSTIAMALGADAADLECEIQTCDETNDISLPAVARTRIVQHHSSSVEMLRRIHDGGPTRFDFLHLDGRVRPEDLAILRELLSPDAVVALDDFEGLAKGVANALAIRGAKLLPEHTLLYPCSRDRLRAWGLLDQSTTALLVPMTALRPGAL